MVTKIGLRLLKSISLKAIPYEIRDSELHGFLIRIQPSGSMTYYYEYRITNGPKNRIKLGSTDKITPAQARDQAQLFAADIIRGIDPKQERKSGDHVTLQAYIENTYGP